MYDTRPHHKPAEIRRSSLLRALAAARRPPLGCTRMGLFASLVGAAVLAGFWFRFERKLSLSTATISSLEERLRELTMRVDVAEHDAVAASAHAEVAESVLLEKGYADADDLEAARRRLQGEPVSGARARDGELN